MSPRIVLTSFSILLAALGVPALFAPDLLTPHLGLGEAGELPVQLSGGALVAFAALDWMGRGAVYGGVYGRPIVVANLALGFTFAGTVTDAILDGRVAGGGWALVAAFAWIAGGSYHLMRRPPWGARAEPPRG